MAVASRTRAATQQPAVGQLGAIRLELVLAPPPARWRRPLNLLGVGMSWNSFPIVLENEEELHCYGS